MHTPMLVSAITVTLLHLAFGQVQLGPSLVPDEVSITGVNGDLRIERRQTISVMEMSNQVCSPTLPDPSNRPISRFVELLVK